MEPKETKKVSINISKDLTFFLGEDQGEVKSNAFRPQVLEDQKSFVESGTLPTDIGRYSRYDERAILEKFGVIFHGEVPEDSILQYVTLPPGWKKIATDQSNWYNLVDEKGRNRAEICFDASFHNRRAFMHLKQRFVVDFDFERSVKDGVACAVIKDCGKTIRRSEPPMHLDVRNRSRIEIVNRVIQNAVQCLDIYLPQWKDPGAYWDKTDLSDYLKNR